jgi:hypothetical protein
MGENFELRIDHSCVKYSLEKPTLNSRQVTWLEFFSDYDFEIKNIKDKHKKVVDVLNRRVHKMHVTTISMYRSNLEDKILGATTSFTSKGNIAPR